MSKKNPRPDKPTSTPMPNITGPGGRSSLYRQEYDQMLIDHMSSGLSFECFGGVVNVAESTLYEWVEHNASFKEAKQTAFTKYRLFWEKLGVYYIVEGQKRDIHDANGRVIGKTTGKEKLNSNIYRLNMANRFKWTNTGSDESDGSGGVTINLHSAIMKAIEDKRKKKG